MCLDDLGGGSRGDAEQQKRSLEESMDEYVKGVPGAWDSLRPLLEQLVRAVLPSVLGYDGALVEHATRYVIRQIRREKASWRHKAGNNLREWIRTLAWKIPREGKWEEWRRDEQLKQWMTKACAGDTAALDELLRAIEPTVQSKAGWVLWRKRHTNEELIDHVVHEVRLKISNAAKKGTWQARPESLFDGWLWTVVGSAVVDLMRKLKLKPGERQDEADDDGREMSDAIEVVADRRISLSKVIEIAEVLVLALCKFVPKAGDPKAVRTWNVILLRYYGELRPELLAELVTAVRQRNGLCSMTLAVRMVSGFMRRWTKCEDIQSITGVPLATISAICERYRQEVRRLGDAGE